MEPWRAMAFRSDGQPMRFGDFFQCVQCGQPMFYCSGAVRFDRESKPHCPKCVEKAMPRYLAWVKGRSIARANKDKTFIFDGEVYPAYD